MKKILLGLLALILFITSTLRAPEIFAAGQDIITWWDVQSIDTVKYSRDIVREKLKDQSFDQIIESQIKNISEIGATHVAIGTPYDREFYPFLKRWVYYARKYGLNIWFRGNISGWEGWFGYPTIDKDMHTQMVVDFIKLNSDMFADGDIFDPCPECENGSLGDPRSEVDLRIYRDFLIDEYMAVEKSFADIGKDVMIIYSMNGDVARLVMDRQTTQELGGVVTVDHYVSDFDQLADDVGTIAVASGGKVLLGEFGAPIPDIHGKMTGNQQAVWLESALLRLSEIESLIGVNYWAGFGSSTALWNDDESERPGVDKIKEIYEPKVLSGVVKNEIGSPIEDARVEFGMTTVYTDEKGKYELKYIQGEFDLIVSADGYKTLVVQRLADMDEIKLEKSQEGVLFKFAKLIYRLIDKFN